MRGPWPVLFLLVLAALGAACQPVKRVVILVDGERRIFETRLATVDDVLHEAKIQVGPDDRVDPPGYTTIERTATIRIVRVETTTEKEREPIDFQAQTSLDESLPQGQRRVIQLGANGEAEITYQVTLEDHKEVSRHEVGRAVITPPRDEITVVGTQSSLSPVAIQGTVVYLAQGNAWVMRSSSNDKRALTVEADLDGRVFDLSPDRRYLLFSRKNAQGLDSLWTVDTVLIGEKPHRLPLDNLLYAQWGPDGSNRIAYSTGVRTDGAPGWKANNDLYIADLRSRADNSFDVVSSRELISPSVPGPLAWWGGDLDWAPDGQVFAWGLTNRLDLVDQQSGIRRTVKPFAYYSTDADWVWTPHVDWSPDSRFIVATVHAAPEGAGGPEESDKFDLWVLARDSSVKLALALNTGMWSSPTWSPPDSKGESKIAFGVALDSSEGERARYALDLLNRDGSNRRRIWPKGQEPGLELIRLAWSPDGSQLLAVRDADLWLYDLTRDTWSQLTANGETSLVAWR